MVGSVVFYVMSIQQKCQQPTGFGFLFCGVLVEKIKNLLNLESHWTSSSQISEFSHDSLVTSVARILSFLSASCGASNKQNKNFEIRLCCVTYHLNYLQSLYPNHATAWRCGWTYRGANDLLTFQEPSWESKLLKVHSPQLGDNGLA